MATIFRARKNANANNEVAGSGGKIMRGRRVLDVRSPYARPPATSPSSSPSQNPSRLLGLISPASRMITGAAKMISGVFFPDSPPTSSSSDDDSDDDDDDISSQGDDRLHQNGATLDTNKYNEGNLQLTVLNNEAKLVIEQLLTQQTFSREECNKLVKLIESRVMESPASREGGDASRSVLADRAPGTSIITLPGAFQSEGQVDICNTAVMEAKKWVQEKKTESYSQLDKSRGIFPSDPYMLSNVTEGELGSPVLMAKSYMKSRPPWASPTAGNIGFQTTSPFGMSHSNNSKDLKRNSHALDSQNILDGSRRVRFKPEDTDIVQPLSAQYSSQKDDLTSVEAEKREAELGSRIHYSDSFPMTEFAKHSANMPADLAKNNGLSLYDGSGDGALSNVPDVLISDCNQDLDGQHTIVGGGFSNVAQNLVPEILDGPLDKSAVVNSELRCTASEVIKPAIQSDSNDYPGVNGQDEIGMQAEGMQAMKSSHRHPTDSRSQEDHANQKEINGSNVRVAANGFSSAPSSSARANAEASPRPSSNEGGQNLMASKDGGNKLQGSCELLSEASVEIPTNKETNKAGSRSRTSSSKQSKEAGQTETPSVSSPGMKKRASTRVVKQQVAKQPGKYTRRGRGRGK